ncbi:glycosyltransferase family 2 protein [Pseudoalteromonas lipolytica]|uniref:glycosyltransferase family 2 protein n=1 Tax=Pseudoalteromonas lipolytica TaxID=570156 RepID=UPI003B9FD1E0
MKIGIVCPCYNEEEFLESFFSSVRKQTIFNNRAIEVVVLIVDGNSTDKTKMIIENLSQEYVFVHYLENTKRFVSDGLNLAIDFLKDGSFDFMVRMDVHAEYPLNYIEILLSSFLSLEKSGNKVGNVGCAIETMAHNGGLKAEIIAEAMSSKFGVGTSDFRVSGDNLNEVKLVDTVPFGFFRVDTFRKVGGFDVEFIRNQDDEFNHRLSLNGYKLFLIPGIKVKYFSRSSYASLSKMFYQYGLFKPLVSKKLGSPASLRQFVPSIFVFSLFASLLISNFVSPVPILLLSIAYLLMCFIFTIQSKVVKKALFLVFPMSVYTLFLIHFSYGFGYIKGAFKLLVNSKFNKIESSR